MNFTVVMSGGCRAKCHFCTDPMNRAASRDYVANLAKFLVQKPEFLKEVSVSGGDPQLLPISRQSCRCCVCSSLKWF